MGKTARSRRTWDRQLKGGGFSMRRQMSSFDRWLKSYDNLKYVNNDGFTIYAFNRPVLIHKGRKP